MQIQFLSILIAISYILHDNQNAFCEAFTLGTGHYPTIRRTAMLKNAANMYSQNDHGEFFDVDAARKKLEALVADAGGSSAMMLSNLGSEEVKPRPSVNTWMKSSSLSENPLSLPERPTLDVTLPPRGPLTTIERERRSAEIDLLATLDQGDNSISDIWELWFTERGPQAASLLREADELMNEGPEGFGTAEKILRALIEDYGVYFTEPLNRLATLYYLQGRMEEALTLNKMVLAVKPWHFGALSRIVMVYAALRDTQSARQWAAFRLPTFDPEKPNKRRVRWVERAVAEAKVLLEAREDTITRAFGNSDQDWVLTQKTHNMYENDTDSWQ